MNGIEAQAGYRPAHEETLKTVEGAAIMESLGAVATIALAVVGLAGLFAPTMAAIATIVLGASIWIEEGAFVASHSAIPATGESMARISAWSEGLAAEFLGGLTGIVLGILALLGIVPHTLLAVAALVFGATFLFSGMTNATSSSQALMGISALVLGLLALIGMSPLILILSALACLGSSALLRGAVTSARMAMVRR